MSLRNLSEWLRCPICFRDLHPSPPLSLTCANGHSFEANKHGFVSLLAVQPRLGPDAVALLDPRASLLSTGAYEALAHVIAEDTTARRPLRLIDAGCGDGRYATKLLARLPLTTRILAVDDTADAVRHALRHVGRDRADGLVTDTRGQLPVRDEVADVVMNVSAPGNAAEFRRVLKPDGVLVIATTHEDHLSELRDVLPSLDTASRHPSRVAEQFEGHFELDRVTPIRYRISVAREAIGPLHNGNSAGPHDGELRAAFPREVTVSIDVLRFRPRVATKIS